MVGRAALAASLLLAGCLKDAPCEHIAKRYDSLPLLKPIPKSGLHELRVLYLEDKRVPTLDAAGRAELYARVERLTKRWLGFGIKLREVGARDLRAEFAKPQMPFRRPEEDACIAAATLDMGEKSGRFKLEELVAREYKMRGQAVFDRLFPGTAGLSESAARQAAVETFLARHNALAGLSTPSGPLLATSEDGRMYSFTAWASLVRTTQETDFYLTNAAMAVPDDDMPIYVLARGGLTTGFVDNQPGAPYGAAGLVTLLPFLAGERLFNSKAPPTSEAEKLDAAATMWLHELGHFLSRYGEIYGEAGCVHVASEGLDYFNWHRAIRKSDNKCSRLPAVVSKF